MGDLSMSEIEILGKKDGVTYQAVLFYQIGNHVPLSAVANGR